MVNNASECHIHVMQKLRLYETNPGLLFQVSFPADGTGALRATCHPISTILNNHIQIKRPK